MNKVIRDGEVAVLFSPGYGAGWFSWNSSIEECLFDPEIVALVESEATSDIIQAAAERKWPNHYWGGADGLTIEWVPVGTNFRINEYDGFESIEYSYDTKWFTS